MFFSPTYRSQGLCQAMAVAICLFSGLAQAQQDPLWGHKMFDVKEINFGSVAKGADSAVQLKVKNIYQEDIQITNLTTGCGCVSWAEMQQQPLPLPIVIPSGQQRTLTLRLDTVRYDGERKSKGSVTLLDPVHGASTTIDFPVQGYIRRDIVMTPGAVNFGDVDLGKGGERKIDIHYAGRDDWKLTQARATNPNVNVVLRETSRGGGLVNYELLVSLKQQAPIGTVRDQIIIETDDVNNPRLSVLVEGKVEPDIAITDLQFGALTPGQSKSVNVIIRGKKAFKIEELYREKKETSKIQDEAFKIKLNKATSTVHSLPVTFVAPDVPGVFEEDFYVRVTDHPQPFLFKARGRIIEQTGAAKQ